MESHGRCAGPIGGVAHVGVPGCGLREGVLHLPFLLAGTGLLRGSLPDESPGATTPEGERKAPGQPRRAGRSPRPATEVRETVPPPNDGCRFPRPRSIGQYRNARTGSENEAAKGQENPGMGPPGPVSAAPGSHFDRLPVLRACGTDEIPPMRGGNGFGSGRRRRGLPAGRWRERIRSRRERVEQRFRRTRIGWGGKRRIA